MTDPDLATSYNNFYEFGGHKNISRAAQALKIRPWTVTLDGDALADYRRRFPAWQDADDFQLVNPTTDERSG